MTLGSWTTFRGPLLLACEVLNLGSTGGVFLLFSFGARANSRSLVVGKGRYSELLAKANLDFRFSDTQHAFRFQ